MYSKQERMEMVCLASKEVVKTYRAIQDNNSSIARMENEEKNQPGADGEIDYCWLIVPYLEKELERKLGFLLNVYIETNMGPNLPNVDEHGYVD